MTTSSPDRIVFAGTADFAATILQALHQAKHHIVAVYTQPDRPAGRGRQLRASPVKQYAQQHLLPIYQPHDFKHAEAQEELRGHNADIMIVVAYGLILPETVLRIPRWGCINVHASLLPRWRGAAPIAHAMLAGDTETGVSIMQMDKGCDTGPVFVMRRLPIEPDDNQQTLHDRLAKVGAETLLDALPNILLGRLVAVPQPQGGCYAHKLTKQQACLDWQQSAAQLMHCVQAYYAWPVAYSMLDQKTIRIWKAHALAQHSDVHPGTIIAATAKGIDVACGDGVLRLETLQCPGGKPLPVAEILNSKVDDFAPGKQFQVV